MKKKKNSELKRKRNSLNNLDNPIYIGNGLLDQIQRIQTYDKPLTKENFKQSIYELADDFEKIFPFSSWGDKLRKLPDTLFKDLNDESKRIN